MKMAEVDRPLFTAGDYITALTNYGKSDLSESKTKEYLDGLREHFIKESDISSLENFALLLINTQVTTSDSCLPNALNALQALLQYRKALENIPSSELLSSAILVLRKLNELCDVENVTIIKELGFKVLATYPKCVLAEMVNCHLQEIICVIGLFKPVEPTEIKVNKEVVGFLQNILSALPSDSIPHFVQNSASLWLEDLLDSVVEAMNSMIESEYAPYLNCLEAFTVLLKHPYFRSQEWEIEFSLHTESINKFTSTINMHIARGSTVWHRLWIIIMKICRIHIKKYRLGGFLINALVAIVEKSFNMDEVTVCRGYACWKVLISSLAYETDTAYLTSEINVLLQPFKNNIVRDEATALAKFQTFWHLIQSYQTDLAISDDCSVISVFISFIFGNRLDGSAGTGKLSNSVKRQGVEAFANILKHTCCSLVTIIPNLQNKILIKSSLWSDFPFALKKAIYFTHALDTNNAPDLTCARPVTCIWKGLLQLIEEREKKSTGIVLLHQLLDVLQEIINEKCSDDVPWDILFELILVLGDKKRSFIYKLLTYGAKKSLPIFKVMSIIMNPGMALELQRHSTKIMAALIQPLTDSIAKSLKVHWLLSQLTPNLDNSAIRIWTALALSVTESKTYTVSKQRLFPRTLRRLLMWPVKSLTSLRMDRDKFAAVTWYRLASLDLENTFTLGIVQQIMKHLTTSDNYYETTFFRLYITIFLVKYKNLNPQSFIQYAPQLPKIFYNLTIQINGCTQLGNDLPLLVDVIVILLSDITITKDINKAVVVFSCVENIYLILILEVRSRGITPGSTIDNDISEMLEKVFNALIQVNNTSFYVSQLKTLVECFIHNASQVYKSPVYEYIFDVIPRISQETRLCVITATESMSGNAANSNVTVEPDVFNTAETNQITNIKFEENSDEDDTFSEDIIQYCQDSPTATVFNAVSKRVPIVILERVELEQRQPSPNQKIQEPNDSSYRYIEEPEVVQTTTYNVGASTSTAIEVPESHTHFDAVGDTCRPSVPIIKRKLITSVAEDTRLPLTKIKRFSGPKKLIKPSCNSPASSQRVLSPAEINSMENYVNSYMKIATENMQLFKSYIMGQLNGVDISLDATPTAEVGLENMTSECSSPPDLDN